MLQISLWKRVLIWGLVALGVLLATPNAFYTRVEQSNDAKIEIEVSGATPERTALAEQWPGWAPSGLVNLGLDLRGGAHLLAEVQVEDVYADRVDAMWPEVRDTLRDLRDDVGTIRRQDGPDDILSVRISQAEGMGAALEAVRDLFQPVVSLTGVGATNFEAAGDGNILTVQLSEEEKLATDDRTIQQSLEIIRRRVDEVGTREPTIQRQGADRILIQVPGIGSAEELKAIIGTTARLAFHPVVNRTTDANADPGSRNFLLPSVDEADDGQYYIVEQSFVVSGEELVDAQPSFDQNGQPASASGSTQPAPGSLEIIRLKTSGRRSQSCLMTRLSQPRRSSLTFRVVRASSLVTSISSARQTLPCFCVPVPCRPS